MTNKGKIMEQNNKGNVKSKNIADVEKELTKAKILIKIQRKMLKQFMLHDDAGTAYIYLGPHPEDLHNINESKADLESISGIQKYDYILENLYEIETLLEKQDVSEDVLSAIELLQDKYLDLYIVERDKRRED